jgi:hypothetical protein
MAFNVTAQNAKLVESVGNFTNLAVGMIVMASGTAAVTIPALKTVHGFVGCVQGATGVGQYVITTDISTNVVTIETVSEGGSTTGTSVVMYIAWGIAKN